MATVARSADARTASVVRQVDKEVSTTPIGKGAAKSILPLQPVPHSMREVSERSEIQDDV